MIVREFPDIQAIQSNKVEKKIIDLFYLLEEQIRMESVPHVVEHHTFICARRALAESVTLSGLSENFPWIFAIYHRYLADRQTAVCTVLKYQVAEGESKNLAIRRGGGCGFFLE